MVISVICPQEISDVTLVQRKKKIATSLFLAKAVFSLEEIQVVCCCQAA